MSLWGSWERPRRIGRSDGTAVLSKSHSMAGGARLAGNHGVPRIPYPVVAIGSTGVVVPIGHRGDKTHVGQAFGGPAPGTPVSP